MKVATTILLASLILSGCAITALRPGRSVISPEKVLLQQSQNPKAESTQKYEKITETVFALPDDPRVVSKKITEKVDTTIGAAQKDAAREIGAKLSSLKGVVWIGVLVFLFGAASAFYPPLKALVGSVTTSAVVCAAGIALIVLPSLVVGNEILILSVSAGSIGLYWFAHRHASVHSELKTLKKGE